MWPFKPDAPTYDAEETNIGNVIKDMGLITQAQLDDAALHHFATSTRMGDTMVELGYITEEHLERALCIQKDLRTGGREVLGQMGIIDEHVRSRKVTQSSMRTLFASVPH